MASVYDSITMLSAIPHAEWYMDMDYYTVVVVVDWRRCSKWCVCVCEMQSFTFSMRGSRSAFAFIIFFALNYILCGARERATIHFHMNEIRMERMNGKWWNKCVQVCVCVWPTCTSDYLAAWLLPLCELWINENRIHAATVAAERLVETEIYGNKFIGVCSAEWTTMLSTAVIELGFGSKAW